MTDTASPAAGIGNLRGIAAISSAMAFLVTNDILMKLSNTSLPLGQLLFMRGLIATILIAIICVGLGAHKQLRQLVEWPVAGRAFANLASSFCYITALFHMPIANVTAIMQATPLLLTALAALLLKEPVGWRRMLAILIGFFGVLLIVKPGTGGFNNYAFLALAAIIFVCARDLFTRVVQANVPSIIVTLATSIVVTTGGGLYSLFEGWAAFGWRELGIVSVAAVCLVCGYHLTIVAMRSGEIAIVSPFRFSIVLWAMLGGYLIWSEVPGLSTLAGIGLIVAMGAYTFHRERLRNQNERLLAAPTRREI